MNDNIPAVNTVHGHDSEISSRQRRIKTGLCINCMYKFITQTGGLNDIYTKWLASAKHTSER